MGGQQFRQFFTPGARSSLLGPVPMGMAIKSPIMGFPAARPFHPHARYYSNNTATTASSSSNATVITAALKRLYLLYRIIAQLMCTVRAVTMTNLSQFDNVASLKSNKSFQQIFTYFCI